MRELLIIAGPQSSGKTTAFNYLKNKLINNRKKKETVKFIPEINPYSIAGKNHLGGAFTNKELEIKIIEKDLEILKNIKILPDYITPIIIETGIFHLVYGEIFCGKSLTNIFYKKYLRLHKNLKTKIIFIETKPKVSWKRRKAIYKKRTANFTNPQGRKEVLERYRLTIERLYPLWLKWYKKMPFEKYMIKNSYKKKEVFLQEVLNLFF